MAKVIRPLRFAGDLVYIPLTQGFEAIIDASDVGHVAGRNWYACTCSNITYAHSRFHIPGIGARPVKLHRLLLQPGEGLFVDHIDGDGLNNRRSNLRVATKGENNINRGMQKNNSTGFKGVFWHRQRAKWMAQIGHHKRCVHLGLFDTPEEASLAYREASQKLHGEFARLG